MGEVYNCTFHYNDGIKPESESYQMSSFTFTTEEFHIWTSRNIETAGKLIKVINYIKLDTIDKKTNFPIKSKGNFKCKIVFNNKDEYEFDFIDYKANTWDNLMDTLDDPNMLIIYPDFEHCIIIPFRNVYQFSYKKENEEYKIVRNNEINNRDSHKYEFYHRRLYNI